MNTKNRQVSDCVLCGSKDLFFYPIISNSPLANKLENSLDKSFNSPRFPLNLLKCINCHHIQLSIAVDPESLFSNYPYKTGISEEFLNHFKEYAKNSINIFKKINKSRTTKNLKILDIGCNDGSLLDSFKTHDCLTFGFEPAKNLVKEIGPRHQIYNDFFNKKTAQKFLTLFGQVDIITANNVFAHSRLLKEFIKSFDLLLKPEGLCIFEFQYLFDLTRGTYFDMIYHEHTSYHHILPMKKFLETYGFSIIKAERIETHGGSIRLICSKSSNHKELDKSSLKLMHEDRNHDKNIGTSLLEFHQKIKKITCSIEKIISNTKEKGGKIWGYSAPAKTTSIISTLSKEASELIEFIVDDNQLKQNKFIPGTGIKIISSKEAQKMTYSDHDLCIIFAWNLFGSISKRFLDLGFTKGFILKPLPQPLIKKITAL